jgi:hypothetical protein
MIGGARVHLLRGARVEGQRGRPGLHETGADFERRPRAVLDSAAQLHAHRDVDGLGDGLDDRRGAVGLVEQRRARPGLRHLSDGAAEVDVHEVGAGRLDHAGRLGHHAGLGPEDLDRQRMLVTADTEIPQRALVSVREAGAADHLGAHQTGAVPPSLAAKCLHAHACHRGEHEPRMYLDGADAPGSVQIDTHGKGIVAVARTFSV